MLFLLLCLSRLVDVSSFLGVRQVTSISPRQQLVVSSYMYSIQCFTARAASRWFPARKRQVAGKDVLLVGRPELELGCRHMVIFVVVDESIPTSDMDHDIRGNTDKMSNPPRTCKTNGSSRLFSRVG